MHAARHRGGQGPFLILVLLGRKNGVLVWVLFVGVFCPLPCYAVRERLEICLHFRVRSGLGRSWELRRRRTLQ